jgi:nucleotide-binding universal stress UspA family protein
LIEEEKLPSAAPAISSVLFVSCFPHQQIPVVSPIVLFSGSPAIAEKRVFHSGLRCQSDGLKNPGTDTGSGSCMFKRVLVATDFSAHADTMLGCIGEIPGMDEIVLVHVINEAGAEARNGFWRGRQSSLREEVAASLEKKRQFLEKTTRLPVSGRIIEAAYGDIAGAIIRLAHMENFPLIVMGGRGKGLLSGYILGSVSEGVIQRSRTDVLIMHFRGLKNPGTAVHEKFCRNVFFHVLCPVDFSKPSGKTLEYARSLGSIRRVTLLHVVDLKKAGPDPSLHIDVCRQKMALIETDLAQKGIRAASLIRPGSPAREIARVAEELDVSLIMMARLGQSDYIKNIPIGGVAAGVVMHAERPLFIVNPHISLNVLVKELGAPDFPLAEQVWLGYHQQKANPSSDRVFSVFIEDTLVAAARCRRHPDGLEVDAVFVPDQYRGRGYARMAVRELVNACGNEPLYMHATLDLIGFYGTFGFTKIGEQELPPSIRDRFSFADGDLAGANVSPMKRVPPENPALTVYG